MARLGCTMADLRTKYAGLHKNLVFGRIGNFRVTTGRERDPGTSFFFYFSSLLLRSIVMFNQK